MDFLQTLPYPALLILAILTIALTQKSKPTFNKLFMTGFLTFGIMSLFIYLYLIIFVNPNSGITLFGHLWRFGFITIVGVVSSLLVSLAARRLAS